MTNVGILEDLFLKTLDEILIDLMDIDPDSNILRNLMARIGLAKKFDRESVVVNIVGKSISDHWVDIESENYDAIPSIVELRYLMGDTMTPAEQLVIKSSKFVKGKVVQRGINANDIKLTVDTFGYLVNIIKSLKGGEKVVMKTNLKKLVNKYNSLPDEYKSDN